MMKLFVLACLLGTSLAADFVDPADCSTFPCLIFDDEFNYLDHNAWEHEITMSGGGNWEFEAYVNNRSNSYTKNSVLYIKPDLTDNWKGDGFVSSGELNLWGMNGRGDVCTGNSYYGCDRFGDAVNYVNPITSARMRSQLGFSFKYGRVEVQAQMPSGDWLWPAVWMMNKHWGYGPWPASGEIDIIESRGNEDYGTLGNGYAGTTLHWGPYWPLNRYDLTTVNYQPATAGSFADGFHKWRMDWTATNMIFYLDDVEIMNVDPVTDFFTYGGFASEGDIDNPWEGQEKMAPFDQEFYFILNLAVGGTNGFFPDNVPNSNKPWANTSPQAFKDFYDNKAQWYPSWSDVDGKISETAALKIDYIKVWKLE